MTKFHRIVRIDHTADNLYDLVADIQKYPTFIRWIQTMDVKHLSSRGNENSKIGTAKIGFKGFSETMATRVDANAEARTIKVSLVSGPLKKLENHWSFKEAETGSGTDIDFSVDFEFRNFLLRALAASNFELAVNRIMAAFVAEADRRYK